MKYKNAAEVLPPELIGQIQEYIQGAFLYIPKKEKQAHRAVTEYRLELDKRNLRIYKMHLEGMTNGQLAQNFSLAQSSIRRILIGQRKRYEMMCGKIQSLLWQWNLQQQRITQIHPSVWQIGEDHVLKVYDQPESLNRNIMINTHLERMGIPVGRLIPTVEGADYAADGDAYYLVSEKLPGSNLISLKFDGKTAEAMGSIIARLHLAFESLEEQVSLWDNSLLDEMNGWVRDRFEETGFAHISREDFDLVVRNLASSYEKLPFGLIHRDVHFGNFLFHNKKFSGYIDFDLTQRNIRVFDLCYFSLSVLSEKEKFEITPENWFDFTRNVFAGYHKLVELTRQEKESAVYVMECIELLFLAYFEGQEDTLQAQSAWEVFRFIRENENRIIRLMPQ